jgi:hypothetical protein
VHPSKRIRALAATAHAALLARPAVRTTLLTHLRDAAPAADAATVLGAWLLAAHDADRQVAAAARRTWTACTRVGDGADTLLQLDAAQLAALLAFVQRAAMDPAGAYTDINPPPPAYAPPPQPHVKKGAKPPPPPPKREEEPRARADEDEELAQDRAARLRTGALGALGWIAGRLFTSLQAGVMLSGLQRRRRVRHPRKRTRSRRRCQSLRSGRRCIMVHARRGSTARTTRLDTRSPSCAARRGRCCRRCCGTPKVGWRPPTPYLVC